MDDIRAGLSEMAQHGEGAQRTQAYRMLMNMESATVVLPDPLTLDECLDRGARILKAMGRENAQVCYRRAFPNAKTHAETPPKYSLEHLPAKVRYAAQQVRSLRQFYKAFPELKAKGGLPTGFPVGQGKITQARWCQQEAAKIFLSRFQEEASPIEGHGSSTENLPTGQETVPLAGD